MGRNLRNCHEADEQVNKEESLSMCANTPFIAPLQRLKNFDGSFRSVKPRLAKQLTHIQVEGASLQLQHNNFLGGKEEHVTIRVEPDATQMQGVAEQSSCSISRPMDESESGSSIMFYAVPIILVVAEILLSLHLFEVI